MELKPVVINTKIQVNKNPIGIVPGTFIDVRIEIVDEFAFIRTSNSFFTKDLAKTAKPGEIAKYSERLQKTIVKYPGKSQKEITAIIAKDLGGLPKNA